MKLLVTYGTYSGSTRMAADVVKEELERLGHTVTAADIQKSKPSDLEGYDAFFLGTNTWYENNQEGMMHGGYAAFREAAGGAKLLNGRPAAVFALGDSAQYLSFCKSADHLEQLVAELGGRCVTPPLKLDKFQFDPHSKTEEIRDWVHSALKAIIAS